MAGMGRRTYLRDVNPYLVCPLCRGYLIDATTVVECLHSFCRSCILKHLSSQAHCPSCKHVLNKAKPNIKADKALQDIVYKLVPGLYHREMRRRRDFYKKHPEHGCAESLHHLGGADFATPEQRGEDVSGRLIFAPEDAVSLSLEYLPPGADPLSILLSTNDADSAAQINAMNNNGSTTNRRYLQCPALVTIAHLKKFLALKYSVDMTRYTIEICHRRAPLPEHWTLMDVAYIYAWKRNAPMRFFYRVAQEEQRLEAPPHDRPSTPGLGASLPPVDVVAVTSEEASGKVAADSRNVVVNKLEAEQQPPRSIPKDVAKCTNASAKLKVQPTVEKLPAERVESSDKIGTALEEKKEDAEAKQIKSPIKILKNPDGRYEVMKSPPPVRSSADQSGGSSDDPKASSPEFSVVSIGDGQNSSGVKITLKQCSPGSGAASKKPKVISNVLLRCGQIEKDTTGAMVVQQQQQLHKEKDKGATDKQEKQRRRVTFLDRPTTTGKSDVEMKSALKKQFLHSFQLTARDARTDAVMSDSNCKTNVIGAIRTGSGAEKRNSNDSVGNENNNGTGVNDGVATVSSVGTADTSVTVGDGNNGSARKKDGNANENAYGSANSNAAKIDVYAFPNEPPVLPAGAVKRKCPPGLPLFDAKRKKHQTHGHGGRKVTAPVAFGLVKTAQRTPIDPGKSSGSSTANSSSSSNNPAPAGPAAQPKPAPMLSNDTRNLLDGCGLNIPASLSITLTAPKSPASGSASVEPAKDNQTFLGKVNPSITLNDRSVDPRVLKALKSGQIRMPAPPKPKSRQTEREVKAGGKRKRDQDSREVLDLSGGRKMDVHPLRIPQPISKLKGKPPARENATGHGQVVTLMGGQRYYRAPPGSLTPAAHRVTECPLPAPPRTPVYAPSCLTSPMTSGRSGNLSSVFPSLQSLYALSQAPNLQQFQMDARLRLPRIDGNASGSPGKSHLAAQCAPVKPARTSGASLAVPIVKQSNGSSTSNPATSRLFNGGNKGPTSAGEMSSTKDVNRSFAEPKTPSVVSSKDNNPIQPVVSPSQGRSEINGVAPSNAESNLQETASPRVSSTASPSPPPANAGTVVTNASNASEDDPVVSDPEKSSTSGAEVTSTKSPASPDSSSILIESPANKSRDQVPVSSQTSARAKVDATYSDPSTKLDETVDEDLRSEMSNKVMIDPNKLPDTKQMTSEMFQKRLLAAFPSNEWANNPIAAEHLGNFLKSLTSMQPESQVGSEIIDSEKNKSVASNTTKDDLSSKSKTEANE